MMGFILENKALQIEVLSDEIMTHHIKGRFRKNILNKNS